MRAQEWRASVNSSTSEYLTWITKMDLHVQQVVMFHLISSLYSVHFQFSSWLFFLASVFLQLKSQSNVQFKRPLNGIFETKFGQYIKNLVGDLKPTLAEFGHFLAHLDKVQEELLYYPWRRRVSTLKFFI